MNFIQILTNPNYLKNINNLILKFNELNYHVNILESNLSYDQKNKINNNIIKYINFNNLKLLSPNNLLSNKNDIGKIYENYNLLLIKYLVLLNLQGKISKNEFQKHISSIQSIKPTESIESNISTTTPTIKPEQNQICFEKYHPFVNVDPLYAEEKTNLLLSSANISSIIKKINNFNFPKATNFENLPLFPELKSEKENVRTADPFYNHKAILTDFVNENFITEENTWINFLILAHNVLNSLICEYIKQNSLKDKDVVLVYKGGNAMKAVFKRTAVDLSGESIDMIYKEFKQYFKKSDVDFSIYINKDLGDDKFNKIRSDMEKLSYFGLYKIRIILMMNLTKYFDIYKHKNIYVQEKMKKVINNLNDLYRVNKYRPESKFDEKRIEYLINEIEFFDFEFLDRNYTDTRINPKVDYSTVPKIEIKSYPDAIIEPYFDTIFRPELGAVRITRKDIKISKCDPKDNEKCFNSLDLKENLQGEPISIKDLEGINYVITLNDSNLSDLDDYQVKKNIFVNNENCEFYISMNDSISEIRNGKLFLKFTLLRLKVHFRFIFKLKNEQKFNTVSIPGEIIDVSIAALDEKNKSFDMNKSITKYVLQGYEKIDGSSCIFSNSLEFYSYTLNYFVKDLFTILFVESFVPWTDFKYQKRLARLVYLCFADQLSIKNILQTKNEFSDFDNICTQINNKKPEFGDLSSLKVTIPTDPNFIKKSGEIIGDINSFDKLYNSTLDLWLACLNQGSKPEILIKFNENQGLFITNFYKYIEELQKYIKITINLCDKIKEHKEKEKPLEYKDKIILHDL